MRTILIVFAINDSFLLLSNNHLMASEAKNANENLNNLSLPFKSRTLVSVPNERFRIRAILTDLQIISCNWNLLLKSDSKQVTAITAH